jgi:hypothetical protein
LFEAEMIALKKIVEAQHDCALFREFSRITRARSDSQMPFKRSRPIRDAFIYLVGSSQ